MNNKLFYSALLTTFVAFNAAAKDKKIDPKWTEQWDPEPRVVEPGPVPSDAIVLFDGTNMDAWQHGNGDPVKWTIEDGAVTVLPKSKGIKTKQKFCDMQLHIEWRSPEKVKNKSGQGLGNSGIFLQSRYEVQILNSYQNRTYANGQAGAIYKQTPPLVNAMKPTGEWQTYDILYQAPRFDDDGDLIKKAHVTVLHNGIVIQNHTEIQGPTLYRGIPQYKAHGCESFYLQDHSDKVSFRNIWVREL
ncbi:DUF1080 domain-containing protein [Saccharobesus litoralis]|uniref:DUF1080 domain-containing protein n=1 Tax=Saccharobesus litoralis TaxID=2172099 RepID=A0A2S0VT79_9ALTE|nr:DUF1080 domain-containing protein [Saccharobesus litoralis]AWB67414.1 DUF1080 domain-containing protein [Saccharobesus litoralis]